MIEAGWSGDEAKRALRRLIAVDNMIQKENAKVETELAATAWRLAKNGETVSRRIAWSR